MEQRTLNNVSTGLNINNIFYLEVSGGQRFDLILNAGHF
jgi:hypothetical protein